MLNSFESAIQFYSTSMFRMAGMENPSLGTVGVGGSSDYSSALMLYYLNLWFPFYELLSATGCYDD